VGLQTPTPKIEVKNMAYRFGFHPINASDSYKRNTIWNYIIQENNDLATSIVPLPKNYNDPYGYMARVREKLKNMPSKKLNDLYLSLNQS